MLALSRKFLDDGVNCKFAVILTEQSAAKQKICESLDEFGVLKAFKVSESLSPELTVPAWAGNRDFDVETTKIDLLGAASSGNLTYYFCNLDDCWLSLVLKLTKRLGCTAVMIRSSSSYVGPNEYIQEITVMESGKMSRVLRVSYDAGWQFVNSGPPLSFEDPSRYARRKIKDRLSRPYLLGLVDGLTVHCSEGALPFLKCQWDRHRLRHDSAGGLLN